MPSSSPTVSTPAWMSVAVGVATPATAVSASPQATIIAPWMTGFMSMRRATVCVMSSRPSMYLSA